MGGNSSSRHVSLDDEEGVTFVKGIRLSERVIDRMKESQHVQTSTKSSMQSEKTERSVPDERHVPIMPHPPSYVSTLVPSEPPTHSVPVNEETSTPASPVGPPTGDEHVVLPAELINIPSTSDSITPPELPNAPVEPFTPVLTLTTDPEANTTPPITGSLGSSVEPVVVQNELLVTESTTSSSPDLPVETSPFPTSIPDSSSSAVVLPDEMSSSAIEAFGESPVSCLSPVEEPVVPSVSDQVFPSQMHVDEEKLRKEIREDLLKQMSEEMKMAEHNIRQQLDEEKAKAKAQAQAAARRQIEEEVKKLLEEEKKSQQQTLADAIRREELSVQDERLITQYYAQKLEEKEKDLKNQDDLFRQQIAKMEEKMSQFTKVTAENYKKGLEDAQTRFRRYRIKPVCSDLQSQILKCYAENKGQTMSCSNIASLYIQCVDRAKQDKKLSTGG
ncbi:coiled-coil-helix-coiled-coil-helix domain containing 3b isoform X2 [Danio aesculapii]|uniref:coiled-coil-helix-coiled-coil-helix domain containing 3b isoform X2 n=1 Tax=Danio aesculapii TaxID=1142201 RepID=UPI0024BF7481|nr:coiled-coil-helix-coiled-coil-helix domain containing 3b isoform X2 [Danio aesculapii]